MWLFLSIASALLFAISALFDKKLSTDRGIFSASWMIHGFGLPFMLMLVFFFGHFLHLASLGWNFSWPLLIIWFVLYPIQTYFYVRSLREGEVSYVMPLMSALPVFNIFVSWFLLHEVPSLFGVLGILVICIAVFVLLLPKGKNPFKLMHYSRAGLFMIIFCLCVAFGSSLDKIALHASEPMFYTLINTLGGTVMLYIMMLFTDHKSDDLSYIRKNKGFLFTVGLVQALAFAAYIFAINGGFVSYILAIRTSSIVISAALAFLVYKEKITRQKSLSIILIIIGLVFLAMA